MLVSDVCNKDELSSLIISELKEFGIKYRKEKRNKSAQEKSCKRIFQIPLASLELIDVVLANGGIVQIPKFVAESCQRILEQVDTEGLFRKAGSAIRQKEIRMGLEAGLPLGRTHHVIDVANVLKSFFRELPEPLLPSSIQEPLLRSYICGERGIKPLLMSCLLLPNLSVNTLAFFMQFLNTVSLSAHKNKMTIENLAIIFTPGLMPLADIGGIRFNNHVKVIQLLILHSEKIGVLPERIAEKLHQSLKTPSKSTDADKKKKKRRSGSLTRMFNGLRKIVGVIGSSENLENTPDNNQVTPCLTKSSKKRKLSEVSAFSAKKKKDVLSMFPENGGLLPNTPLCDKDTKKTRLSLGGRKNSKCGAGGSIQQSVERRWSIVGPGWNRKKQHQEDLKKTEQKTLSPVVSLPCISRIDEALKSISPADRNTSSDMSNNYQPRNVFDEDYVRIPKSEYEAIKERVSAIETRISQEFGSVKNSMLLSTSSDLDSSLSGPEKVLNKFERTIEETGNMTSSPSTDQLAKRLSRELKIRRSEEHKIIRSPSARKIGTMRRRSKENVKLSRNKTWHITNKSDGQRTATDVIGGISFYPKSNLKRGRPNTLYTGLHQPNPMSKSDSDNCKEENWTAGELFFNASNKMESNVGSTTVEMDSHNVSIEENVNRLVNNTATTPRFVTTITLSDEKTPMLPPRSIPKKQSAYKTPGWTSKSKQNTAPPVEEGQNGRASIARLRSQNAGMVLAKAKLFDELGNECEVKSQKPSSTDSKKNNRFKFQDELKHCYVVPNRSAITKLTDSSNTKTPRRKNLSRSPSSSQKQQKLKFQRMTSRLTAQNICDSESIQEQKSKILSTKIMNGNRLNDSPYKCTPKIKKSLKVNSPRRFVRTPRGQSTVTGSRTPLKATPIILRNSPRLKLQAEKRSN